MSFYVVAFPTENDDHYNPGDGFIYHGLHPYQTREEAERIAQYETRRDQELAEEYLEEFPGKSAEKLVNIHHWFVIEE